MSDDRYSFLNTGFAWIEAIDDPFYIFFEKTNNILILFVYERWPLARRLVEGDNFEGAEEGQFGRLGDKMRFAGKRRGERTARRDPMDLGEVCRSRKKPRERRSELCNVLFLQYLTSRVLTFYEAIKFPFIFLCMPKKGHALNLYLKVPYDRCCSLLRYFFLAGSIQGLTGFGGALVGIPLLSLVMDVKQAIPLAILNGLVVTATLAYTLRRLLDWRKILPLVIGSIPGIMLGTAVLRQADPGVINRLLGLVLLGISGFNLCCSPGPINPPRIWGYVAGFFSGAINATVGAGGPPAIIYTSLHDWTKDEIRATLTGFFVINGYVTAAVYAGSGIITGQTLRLFAFTWGCVLMGTMTGFRISNRIRRGTYLRIVHLLLMGLGLMLLFR